MTSVAAIQPPSAPKCSSSTAERAEVLVEQGARAVGHGLLGEFVQALVGDLGGVLGAEIQRIHVGVGMQGLRRQPGAFEAIVTDERALLGHGLEQDRRIGGLGEALDAQHDLHLDRRPLLEFLLDVPLAVRGLAPSRPVEGDVGHDTRWLALAREPVARLPGQVAEQHVALEVFLERLTLEERRFERVAQRADGIGEDVVEHGCREG